MLYTIDNPWTSPTSAKVEQAVTFYTKPARRIQILVFLKILTFPNSLSLKASTDVKSGRTFQLKPGLAVYNSIFHQWNKKVV